MEPTLNKDKLISLIESLNYDSPVIDEIKVFINSYNGTNINDLNMLVFAIVTFIMGVQEMEVRAEGFDSMEYENALFQDKLAEMKRQYEILNSGKLPKEPFTPHKGKPQQTE
ncbi:hypothetical protein A2415_05500 [candidate division WWE3 bacterium RIFOXYC1_FULL_39_7]|uniref:Uncharacterized protein n=1 Tax=candidate division WWE3 bacterium RIFOXYC1_FULL_39_7 TaxID=1802643 RepID=A0A1F4WGJ1_UNCKA|nr:MAG: hypothetical protein A2415_05500 [candidate division WWE3 bacterium RIFOXYC1_FULL_39_7]